MRMYSIHFLTIVSGFCLVWACSGNRIEKKKKWIQTETESGDSLPDDTDHQSTDFSLDPDVALQGRWQAKCEKINNEDSKDTRYQQTAIRFEAREAKISTDIFKRAQCRAISTSSVVTTDFKTAEGNLRKIDYVIKKIELIPRTEADARRFIDVGFCGINDWSVNTSREVSGLKCFDDEEAFPAKGDLFYDVYSVEGQTLFFGLGAALYRREQVILNGSTPEKRPIATVNEPLFTKIKGKNND